MLDTPASVVKRGKRWYKKCGYCGVEQSYLRRGYAINSLLANKRCTRCSSIVNNTKPQYSYKEVRISWFTKHKTGAETRGIDWGITIEEVWSIYVKQGKTCKLSGVPIGWADVGRDHTASIDRIDSSKGYILDNIQLVHKDVNVMKSKYDQDYFISFCRKIATLNNEV